MKKQSMKSKSQKMEPGRTAGKAEGDEQTTEKALKNRQSTNKKSK